MKKIKKIIKRVAIGFGALFLIGLVFTIYTAASMTPEEKAALDQRIEQREAEKKAKLQAEAEAKAKEEQAIVEQQAKSEAEQKAKAEAEAQAKKEEEEKAKAEAEEKAKAEAEKKKQEEAKAKADEQAKLDIFNTGMENLVTASNGVIYAIRITEQSSYLAVEMVVSDAWYYSPEHEKQRFANTFYESIYKIAMGSALIENDDTMYLDIVDYYGEKVAEYSIWSGMKIKK